MIDTDISKVIESGEYADIQAMTEFRHEKAREALLAWRNLPVSRETAMQLCEMPYTDFCNSDVPVVKTVREALFLLVAYCDIKAKDKNILNMYPDKRTIAMSNIRQNDWKNNLIKYKIDPASASAGVRNIIAYIDNPTENWPIASEDHKKMLIAHFDGREYNPDTFNSRMNSIFMPLWQGENRENATAFLTRCLYHIDRVWKNPEIGGLFVHEPYDSWKNELIDDMGDGFGCIWWHTKPSQHGKDILSSLESMIESGDTFKFYYVKNNQATYEATVHDFADKKNYTEKAAEWKAQNPAWLQDEITDHCDNDGKRHAALVFLIKDFRRLPSPIPLNRFSLYRNMSYNTRGGIAAFTNILSESEYQEKMNIENYVRLLEANKNLILTGAPGTGKTYLAHKIASAMDEDVVIDKVQFHPSYDYTDFVEGLRPVKDSGANGQLGFMLRPGKFKSFCAQALKNLTDSDTPGSNVRKKKFVFIIDEINRGELSKIFGELFSAIDPDYRGIKGLVSTQYQNMLEPEDNFHDGFYVPENVYIIGTMNDIDRGVETMDFAIRRRFAWCEVKASENIGMLESLGNLKVEAKKRMERLNEAISKTDFMNDAYHIGGAYFLKVKNYANDLKPFDSLWELHLKGLLAEYLRGSDRIEEKMMNLKNAYNGALTDAGNNN